MRARADVDVLSGVFVSLFVENLMIWAIYSTVHSVVFGGGGNKKRTKGVDAQRAPLNLNLPDAVGYCRDFSEASLFFFSEMLVATLEESENAQPHQHLKPSNSNRTKQSRTTKETQPKDDAPYQFPAVTCPPGNQALQHVFMQGGHGNSSSWEGKDFNRVLSPKMSKPLSISLTIQDFGFFQKFFCWSAESNGEA